MDIFSVLGQVIACFWVADFLTGIFHWAEDTYCLDDIQNWIGIEICDPNILHHISPQEMVENSTFWGRNHIQWAAALLVFSVLAVLGFGFWQVFLVAAFASFGNEVHYWSHKSDPGAIGRFFRESGITQSQKHHNLHHKPPYAINYCVLGQLVNTCLEAVSFWRRLESCIQMVTGIQPKREKRSDSRENENANTS